MEPAVFFDGRSSRRHLVTLAFAGRLEIADAAVPHRGPLASWPYDAVRRVDGPAGTLRLACAAAPPLARLELRDTADRARIIELCRALDGPGSAASVSIWRIAAASLAAAAAIFLMAWFGMPLLADRLSAAMPVSWEAPIGDALDPRVRALFGAACERPGGVAAVRKLVDRLGAAAQLPIKPDPVVLRSGMANAFAVPGGRVYLLSRLIAMARTPDELAGVLAHELGHVDHRDGLRRLIRNGGTSFLVGMMFGDVTGAGAVLLAGRMVLSASYSRADEQSADEFAVAVMHRLGRPTAPMGALLQRMTGSADVKIPALLRDHPLTPERKAMLDAANRPPSGPDLLDPGEWRDLKSVCDR
ncbi:MAG TPA: M48 family metallopeptidase [Stellaceae bacterium]|nr:M48 family metallopeptidase [Stellaceae bacterium]